MGGGGGGVVGVSDEQLQELQAQAERDKKAILEQKGMAEEVV
jgi:hypothetical protein